MSEKRYLIADVSCGCNIIARAKDIDTALLLIKVYTEKYYMEPISLKIMEEPRAEAKKGQLMRKIDINEIKQAVKDGKLSIWVNKYGYIQMKDNKTGERVCLGSMEKDVE